ncbi:MAG: formate dehydrogenase subunit alpha [Thermoplasmata archaeon]
MSYRSVLTTCPYCGCGCQLYLQVVDGNIIGLIPDKTHPISEGSLCIKGWNAHVFVQREDRLRKPLIKENGEFREASWDEALDLVAKKLSEAKEKHGPDSVAVLASAKCTNEENYLIQKLMRAVIGTNNVDHCARLCHASTVTGLAHAFGSGAMTNSVPEIDDSDVILITGSNTIEQHPLIGSRIVKAREKGAKVILVDPRRVPMLMFSDLYLQPTPGTDVAWLNGMMHVILREGLQDEDFIKGRTEGFEAFRAVVEKYDPATVEKISGIPANLLAEAARLFGKAEKASIFYSMGITQHTTGTDNVKSIANLAMLTGNVGRRATGVNPLRGQNNVQGACDVGALPNVYPGYQSVSNEKIAEKFEKAWGSKLSRDPGLTVVEMTDATLEGRVRAMLIVGENPMISDPDIGHVEEALNKLDFLAVQDIFLTETAELADVVLPASSYAEKEGTFTATDRRVQRVRKAIEPVGESREDWKIIADIARRLGGKGFDFASPAEIMQEIAELTPIYGGVSFERLNKGENLLWPCREAGHSGTEFLHEGNFTRGKGAFSPIEFKEADELPDDEYPFILTTGRVMSQYHTGSMTRRTPILESESPSPYVEVNPEDAETLGIEDGDLLEVSSRRGSIRTRARVVKIVSSGVVFIPFHYAEAAANVLTNPAFDPQAKIPELKVCAVALKPVTD